jgi:hypothetical protein
LLTAKPCVINTFGIFAFHFRKLLQRYTSSNLHVAFALWAFCRVIALQQGAWFSFSMQLAVFGCGWAAYQYLHVFVPVLRRQRRLTLLIVFPFALAVSIGFFGLTSQAVSVWMVFGVVGVCTLCYAFPFGEKMGLRYVPTVKVFVVAFCWTALAMLSLHELPSTVFALVTAKSIFWMMCLILPFELRDMNKDEKALKTLPQLLGATGVKILGAVLICVTAFLAFKTVQVTLLLWVEWVMLLLLTIAIFKSTPKRSFAYTSFWVEGIPVLWFLGSVFVLIFY